MNIDDIFSKLNNWAQNFGPNFVLGLSGGGDSVALLLICQKWLMSQKAKELGARIFVINIDHNLAKNSAEVSEFAKNISQNLGFETNIRKIDYKIKSAIQENARNERYKLIAQFAKEKNVRTILIAHNFEDNIETIIFRMMRGTKLFGLAGIRPISLKINDNNQYIIARPLLECTRQELRDFCNENNIEFYNDPANESNNFSRVRIRKQLSIFQNSFDKIIKISKNANIIRSHIERLSFDIITKFSKFDNGIFLPINIFEAQNKLVQENIIMLIIKSMGIDRPIKSQKITRLFDELLNKNFRPKTLGNVIISKNKNYICFKIAPQRKSADKSQINSSVNYNKLLEFSKQNIFIRLASYCNIIIDN